MHSFYSLEILGGNESDRERAKSAIDSILAGYDEQTVREYLSQHDDKSLEWDDDWSPTCIDIELDICEALSQISSQIHAWNFYQIKGPDVPGFEGTMDALESLSIRGL